MSLLEELIYACRENNPKKIKNLIHQGVNINEVYHLNDGNEQNDDTTALNEAISFDSVESVKILIEYNANIHWRDTSYSNQSYLFPNLSLNPSLNMSALKNIIAKKKNIFYQLIEKDIDTNLDTDEGITILIGVCYYNIKEYEEFLRVLIPLSTNINHQDDSQKTALMVACEYGTLEMIKLLLENHARVDLIDEYNNNALYYAQQRVNIQIPSDIIELLSQPHQGGDILLYKYKKYKSKYLLNKKL